MRAFLVLTIAVPVIAPTVGEAARALVHRWPVPEYGTSVELPASWKAVD